MICSSQICKYHSDYLDNTKIFCNFTAKTQETMETIEATAGLNVKAKSLKVFIPLFHTAHPMMYVATQDGRLSNPNLLKIAPKLTY